MDANKAKLIIVLLFIVSCVTFSSGFKKASEAQFERDHDTSKIEIEVLDMSCNQDVTLDEEGNVVWEGKYQLDITYSLKNNTKAAWGYLEIETIVYDASGVAVGTITSRIGSGSYFRLEPGEKETREEHLEAYKNDEFAKYLSEAKVKNLKFKSTVKNAKYYE